MPFLKQESNNKFECVAIGLEAGEHLHMVVRKHWIIFVELGASLLFLLAMCVGIYFIGEFWHIPTLFTALTIVWLLMIGLQYIFVNWVNDELDILILTNKRIIALEQIKFLDRKLSQASIDQVQEVNASTSWFLGNILHYGNLSIQTAGDASDFHLSQIGESLETSRMVHRYIDEYRHELDKE